MAAFARPRGEPCRTTRLRFREAVAGVLSRRGAARHLFRPAAALGPLVAALLLAPAAAAEMREVRLEGDRYYLIDLPARRQGAPLILMLHGGGGNPGQIARNSGLSAAALPRGYAVIYPAGSGRSRLLTWNAGRCCAYAARQGVDDVAFLDAVIDDAVRRFGLDGGSAFLTGMSNGAMMAERYAALRPGRVRAVAGVAGTMDLSTPIRGPVPFLHIHGTADASVPYGGGLGEGVARVRFEPVPDLIAAWRRANRALGPAERRIVDPEPDGMHAAVDDWRDAAGRVMVRLVTIEGGGHVWPGGRRAARSGGPRDISANEEVLRFFDAHR
jgi:polyhydroxybutyrate depolymerase